MWAVKLLVILAIAGFSDANSCAGRCYAALDPAETCQCNSACENYGDCCDDFWALCTDETCSGRCGQAYNSADPCHCNDECKNYGNCCKDYDIYCTSTDDESCSGRCGEDYNSANPCHCNDQCQSYGNCCSDYETLCPSTPGGGGDLSALAQQLWDNDVNRFDIGVDVQFNKQTQLANYHDRIDESPVKLFTALDASKSATGTWPSYQALLDNYHRKTGTGESLNDAEIETFLDAAFATSVMTTTTQYMIDNSHFADEASFRAYLKDIWFTLYTRSSGPMDSSGFEHVFVGEIKNGAVSGYHNWFTFQDDEEVTVSNYYGYTSDNEPNEILMQFTVQDGGTTYWKELASIIAGASPEFELAIFTACFVENPNTISTFTMNGVTQKVQTWDQTVGNEKYIGSTYFSV